MSFTGRKALDSGDKDPIFISTNKTDTIPGIYEATSVHVNLQPTARRL
jgi:hypothetical protein